MKAVNDVRGAFAFLTVIPVGREIDWSQPGRFFAWFPLVGLVIGAGVAAVAANPWWPPSATAFLTLLVWVVLTGGLHLDGFGDAADGLLAAVEPVRRLEIMKDSRAGSWAVVGLILLLLGKFVLLAEAPPLALIVPPVVARWGMVLAAGRFPYARKEGLGGYFQQGLGRTQYLIATVIMLALTLAVAAWVTPLVILLPLAALAVTFVVGRWAANRLGGGLTGDVYGALCELTELICLILLAI